MLLLRVRDHHGRDLQAAECIIANIDQGFGQIKLRDSTVRERIIVNPFELCRFRNGEFRQAHTAVECEIGNLYNAIGQRDIHKVFTAVECALVDTRQLIAFCKVYCREIFTVCKRVIINRNHACGNSDFGEILRAVERAITKRQDIAICRKVNFRQTRIFKRAEADHFHRVRKGQFPFQTCGYGNQLGTALVIQQAVVRAVIFVVFVYRERFQLGQANERVFADIFHVFGNVYGRQARVIEHVGHQLHVAIAPIYRGELSNITECVVVDKRYVVRQRHCREFRAHKRLFGDLRQGDIFCKGHLCQACGFKRRRAEIRQGCRKCDRAQFSTIGECALFNRSKFAILRKGYALQRRIEERVVTDETHICGNGHVFYLAERKRITLNAIQGFGKNNTRHIRIIERVTTDLRNCTKIKSRQIHLGRGTQVFDDCRIAVRKLGIFPIPRRGDVRHANVVSLDAVVPVFIQIQRQRTACEIEFQILRAEEGKSADMLHACGKCQRRHVFTTVEGVSADIRQRLGKVERLQARIETECKVIDIRKVCITEVHRLEFAQAFQAVRLNTRQSTALLEGDIYKVFTAREHISGNAFEFGICRKGDLR